MKRKKERKKESPLPWSISIKQILIKTHPTMLVLHAQVSSNTGEILFETPCISRRAGCWGNMEGMMERGLVSGSCALPCQWWRLLIQTGKPPRTYPAPILPNSHCSHCQGNFWSSGSRIRIHFTSTSRMQLCSFPSKLTDPGSKSWRLDEGENSLRGLLWHCACKHTQTTLPRQVPLHSTSAINCSTVLLNSHARLNRLQWP